MVVTHKLTMDLEGKEQTPWLEVEQWDAYTREIRLLLFSGNLPWSVPQDAKVLICYQKPDGKCGVYDTLPNGEIAWTVAGNALSIVLAPQILTTIGTVMLQAQIIQDEMMLHTFCIEICVRPHIGKGTNGYGEESELYYAVTGILPAPNKAKIGQYIRVQDVNDAGKITRIEAVDIQPEDMVDERLIQGMVDRYLADNPPLNGNPGADGIGITTITIMEV